MAAVAKKHVQFQELNEEIQYEDADEQSGSDGEEHEEEGSENEESDGGVAEDEDGGEDEEESEGNANVGWAEAMAKILGKKTAENKSTILIKNKELDKVKEQEHQEQLERRQQVDKKRAWEMMSREKPDVVKDRETERALQRVATRGVVQLFNAVKKHQKTVDDKLKEVGGSERKKAKILSTVSKKDFVDVLRRTEGVSRKEEKNTVATADDKPAWSVLRDDYMMGGTMKDWDKDSDEEAAPQTGEGAEDSDSD